MKAALRLYTNLLPALALMPDDKEIYPTFDVKLLKSELSNITVFDCRSLPLAFVQNTGAAAFEEMAATKQKVQLPDSDGCYFEFSDNVAVLATEIRFDGGTIESDEKGEPGVVEGTDVHLGTTVEIYGFPGLSIDPSAMASVYEDSDSLFNPFGTFLNGMSLEEYPVFNPEIADFFEISNTATDSSTDEHVEDWSVRVLGVLTLLNDKLVLRHHEPDPMPYINSKRRNKDKLPLSGASNVLTVNVPAVRQTSLRNGPISTHESPALHWRRGHRRVLHRGSEFESATWVRRCLVGDPAKGFIGKDYRLVHRLPMLRSAPP